MHIKLHKDELLDSFVYEQFEVYDFCLLDKMTRVSFIRYNNRANDLLGLVHIDVYGPLNKYARGGFQYLLYLMMILVNMAMCII